jgi:hypothetical protein
MLIASRSSAVLVMMTSLLIGGAALARSSAPLFQENMKTMADIARDRCPNKIENYKNSVNWYRGPNRITVSARTACGSKYGDEYDLTDVTIEIRSGHRLITQVHASDGTFWPGRNEMLIGKSDSAKVADKNGACVPDFNVMQIDLRTGEMKTPGMQVVLNSEDEVKCSLVRRRPGAAVAANM